MNNIELARKSLNGLWIGDCIGNLGQVYFAHDILKALEEGMVKFGGQLDKFHNQFQLSDDTEEAICLYNHLVVNEHIDQDKLSLEFAKRYFERDPDGEKFGYGLMTRTVLREIYEGKPWREANQTKPRIEGPSFVDKLVAGVAEGKSMNESMAIVNSDLKAQMARAPEMKIGSCGNGSAMRVAPLGAFFYNEDPEYLISEAVLQAQVTHCHPEGLAGSIAVVQAAATVARLSQGLLHHHNILQSVYDILPECEVKNGIKKAMGIPFETPLGKVIEILGNGTHVTCQDTVPLCCYLVEKALKTYNKDTMYEDIIIETSKAFGDVDTNCAIVGGIIGTYAEPPQKWVKFCQPMEDVK